MPEPTDPDVVSLAEAASRLGITTKTLSAELNARRIPGRKVGREWRLHWPTVVEWLKQSEHGGPPEPGPPDE